MIVSSNRTNIPIGWSWGPGENSQTIEILLKLIHKANSKIETIISDEGIALCSTIKKVFPTSTHKKCAWHLAKSIKNSIIHKLFWKLVQAEHPLIYQDIINQLKKFKSEEMPQFLNDSKIGCFSSFYEGKKSNDLKTSSPCESINSDIKDLKDKQPIIIFHFLEVLGFSRCLDLLQLSSDMTPYYSRRKNHILQKAQRMQILEDDKFGTHRTVVDSNYCNSQIRWEVDARVYSCCCGKFTDRGYPCAHMAKILQDLNIPIENCVHQCYFTKTIKSYISDDAIENLIIFLSNIVDDLPPIRKKKTISNHSITLGVGQCAHGKLLTTSSAKIMKVKVPKNQIKKEILDKIISDKFGLEENKKITKKQYWMIIKGVLNKCDA